ncbi:Carbonic anhydrase 1 [Commensalibacter sp. Nvir]|uniref:carbonic anhydrase n=1 Tax=Commensalibacter sp. Nvir TaxID=3069817 RepID=UPI002D6E6332|nr:Carbonic anhydrase 1 [Commensalibacter sp. Nvir]
MSDSNPQQVLLDILHGVEKFNKVIFPKQKELFGKLAEGQSPKALFITCADSRISPELLTDQPPGNLFVLRNIGNIIPAYGSLLGGVTSAIEYAVYAIKVSTIIVCGHSNCGAMDGLMHPKKLEFMPAVKNWLQYAETAYAITKARIGTDLGPSHVRNLTEANVLLQLNHLRTYPAVAAALARRQMALQGWYYDIPNGTVRVLDENTQKDMSIEQAIKRLNKYVKEIDEPNF